MEQIERDLPDYTQKPEMPQRIRLIIPAELAGIRLDQALSKLLPQYSRSRLQTWIKADLVKVNGESANIKAPVWGGETVEVDTRPSPSETAFQAEHIPLDIVYEDDSLLVINKPPGLVVHPGSGNWQGTLLNALLHHAPELKNIPRAGIVHRLDKETSGLLVVAKTLIAQTDLVRQLQARTVKREYLALVQGKITGEGTVDAPIGRHPVQRTKMAVAQKGKPAVTHYKVLEAFEHCTLVRCRLETGRTHQIRVHMQSIGHPLVGDPVYGSKAKTSFGFKRQALHAAKLGLIHPVSGNTMEWEAPLPEDMEGLLAGLRK
jgi:23S rRNA pseudouridine1911/1915/1917 synthase